MIKSTTYAMEQHMVATNEDNFATLLATVSPELYIVYEAIKLSKIDPRIIPRLVKAISKVCEGNRFGSIHIEIKPDRDTGRAKVIRIESTDTDYLDTFALTE